LEQTAYLFSDIYCKLAMFVEGFAPILPDIYFENELGDRKVV
jgi:hypothetical protein